MVEPRHRLERAAFLLAGRLERIEARLDDDSAAWTEYRDTVRALAAALEHVAPGRRGELLTTEEMAERLGIAPKTLLKHKARGVVRPAMQRGKLIRWRGDEVPR